MPVRRMLTLALAACALPPFASPAGEPVVEWMQSRAVRLDTVEAGNGFSDMQPLKSIVGDARIVALGEATHGTREFFQLKHRMLEFLAAEMGFTIFSIEANMPEAYRLNEYVLTGKGDPLQLLKGMYFWTWDTQEVLEMILWMRRFNESGPGRVQFTGFDMQTPDVALQIVRDFAAQADPDYAGAALEASERALAPPAPTFGSAGANFPVADAAGKHVRFSGYIKTRDVSGYAGLWWRADGASGVLSFANLGNRAPKGTSDWDRYELEMQVPAETRSIAFGALLAGAGAAWFDELAVEIDSAPYQQRAGLQLLFPSALPARPYTVASGTYSIQLDGQTVRSSSPSLKIQYLGESPTSYSTDPKTLSAIWKDVVRHMESARGEYGNKGFAAAEVEWAIQNARVVLQYAQMKANEVTRDASMAQNIKWILDNSPDEKMVVWAHNGHVATNVENSFEPMGAALRRMFGGQMVVFGFAFNQGSFRAIETSRGLVNFSVPPAPAGTLDARLAATGIPVFALDLRQPGDGDAATWLNQPHRTRRIGAVYSEQSAPAYWWNVAIPLAFDGLLFVETTTAARANINVPAPFHLVRPGDPGKDSLEYEDREYGAAFTLPPGWTLRQASRWGDRETTAWFTDAQSPAFAALYYKVYGEPQPATPEQMRELLMAGAEEKAAQRTAGGFAEYRLRQESFQFRSVNGRAALSCVADYMENGVPMAEYLTFVRSDRASALFFPRVTAAELDAFRLRFDAIIETLRIP